MKKTYALALFGLLLCSSLSLFAASISTDYDHSANFSQYKTYSWLKVQAGDSLWAASHHSRMLTHNLPQRDGQKLRRMGMQALRLSGQLKNNPPWRLSMTGSEEVGDGVAVGGLAADRPGHGYDHH